MFYNADLFDQNLSIWDVSSGANLNYMFENTLASTNQGLASTPNASYFDATTGDDTITGTADVDDALRGHDGDDSLNGLGGNDTIFGDAGNDTIDGGEGDDTMEGGAGDDIYFVDSTSDTV